MAPRRATRWRLVSAIAFCAAYLPCSSLAQNSLEQIIAAEQQRRTDDILAAEEQLVLGDVANNKGEINQALDHYRIGLAALPTAPIADTRRAALENRFATVATARASELRKSGDYATAESLLKEVLDAFPAHADALEELEKLSDPEYSNPALSTEHVAKVREASRLLHLAEGQFNLGLFDQARQTSQSILRIDPYNKAARRLMERIDAQKAAYYQPSYDSTRAQFLNEVAHAWALQQVPKPSLQGNVGEIDASAAETAANNIEQRLRTTIIDDFQVAGEGIDDALRLLQEKINESSPGERPINLVLEIGSEDDETAARILARPVKLTLTEVPALEILRFICSQTGTDLQFDAFAVRVLQIGGDSGSLQVRTFKVPADFLSQSAPQSDDNDPFGSADSSTGLSRRLSAEEFLKQSGVTFPEGSSAQHNSVNNTLYVRNTLSNLRLVEAVVRSLKRETPAQVVFTTTFVEVNQEDLEELGFDWLLDNGALDSQGQGFINGGTPLNNVTSTQFPTQAGGVLSPDNWITGGLRSGVSIFDRDIINERLATQTSFGANSAERAPGVLAFRGIFNDADFMTVMRGLSQKGGTDMLLRPSLVAKPGETATLFAGDEFIYPTEYEPPQIPNGVGGGGGFQGDVGAGGNIFPATPATPTAFEMRELGVVLEVEPTVSSESNIVELRLAPQFTDLLGFIDYGSPIVGLGNDALGNQVPILITENRILQPLFRTRRLNTAVTVADGQTLVIGGLMREKREIVNDSVPILADIPLVGRFFRTEGMKRTKRCVIVFVKVRIIDPGGASIFDGSVAP